MRKLWDRFLGLFRSERSNLSSVDTPAAANKKGHYRHNWQRWKKFEMPILGTMYGRLCQNCPTWEIAAFPFRK